MTSWQVLLDDFIEFMSGLTRIKSLMALRDGFIITTPFVISGSVFLLIANLPIPGYADFMAGVFGSNWTDTLNAVAGATFGALAIIIEVSVTYRYVSAEGCDASAASIISLTTFLILLPPDITTASGEIVGGIIPRNWVGANGILTAIVVAFFVSYVCVYCEKKNLGVKMPESVPIEIARSFEALTPTFVCFVTAAVVHGICHHAFDTTLPELFFHVIQAPLQGLSDTIIGGIVITALQSVLFWAGIHGPNVVGGVASPLLLANSLDNQQLIDMGQQLAGNPAAHIFTTQIDQVFTKSGGCGFTFGLLIASHLVAKSEQFKTIAKIAIVPGLFNINEPIIFGLPIVFNPYMLVPYILAPVAAMLITYTSIAIGFMAPFGAVQVPWTTPPILAGFLLNGWQGAVVQFINLVVAVLIYLPFVKVQDNAFLEEEDAQKGIGDEV